MTKEKSLSNHTSSITSTVAGVGSLLSSRAEDFLMVHGESVFGQGLAYTLAILAAVGVGYLINKVAPALDAKYQRMRASLKNPTIVFQRSSSTRTA